MYKIGEFSKLSGINISTLRHYEKIGILFPERVDPDNSYCYYDNNSFLKAILISGLKEMGFTLKEIKASVDLRDDKSLYDAIQSKKAHLENERRRIEALLGKTEEYLLLYGGKDNAVE